MKRIVAKLEVQDGCNRYTIEKIINTDATNIDFVAQRYAAEYLGKSRRDGQWWCTTDRAIRLIDVKAERTFREKVRVLKEKMISEIKRVAKTKSIKSAFSDENVITIRNKNLWFNLAANHYLIELGEENLIDDMGYRYDYSVLSLEQLSLLADYVR